MRPSGVFSLEGGLKLVDSQTLAAYEQEMTERGIPRIIRDVEKRHQLAAEARQRFPRQRIAHLEKQVAELERLVDGGDLRR